MSHTKHTNHRGSQLRHSTKSARSVDLGRTKPTVSADYIVGLTDGEGCFYVYMSKSPLYRAGVKVQLHFHIKLNARDKDVLMKVKNTLKCGNVYFQKEQRQNHTQCYRYTVAAQRDIVTHIIPFFTTHSLQTDSKKASFDIFCRIAAMIESGRHLTPKGVEQIRILKEGMNQHTVGLA